MAASLVELVAIGCVAGGLVSLALGAFAWRHRDVPAAREFAALAATFTGWSFAVAAKLLADTAGEAYLLDRVARVVGANIVPLVLVFVLAFAREERWLGRRVIAGIWLVPVAYVALSLTAPWHGLASTPADVTLQTANGITAFVVPTDLAARAYVVFAYLGIFASYAVLGRLILRIRTVHQYQAVVIAVGFFVPTAANAAVRLGLSPHPAVDFTPITYVVSAIVVAWGLFKYDLFSVTPMANDVLVSELPDPVVVLDNDGRVLDHNPAAGELFDESLVDSHVHDAAPGLLETVTGNETYSVATDGEGGVAYFDPQAASIDDRRGHELGRLVVLRDVTGQQRRQDRLEALQSATQEFIAARTAEEIADHVVTFASRVLDQDAAAVLLADDEAGELRPVAFTEAVAEYFDEAELVVEDDPESPIWTTYQEGASRTVDVRGRSEADPFATLLLLPLGDLGVLAIGSEERSSFRPEDEQFASILAQTTQVALSQVQFERQLIESHNAVERRSEQIEFFNGVLRHTLRNALLVIQGRANHLASDLDDDACRHVDVIQRWCDDLADLNEQIKSINDTVTATDSERRDSVDIAAMIRERVRAVERDHPEVAITLDVDEELSVLANELAGKVVEDVLLNAIQHNDADDPRVDLWARRAADRVQIHVEDNGPGISDEMKETVFERDLSTAQSSTGFGLYFVSVMMNLFGGTVWFEDNDPNGAVAVLEFQAADE